MRQLNLTPDGNALDHLPDKLRAAVIQTTSDDTDTDTQRNSNLSAIADKVSQAKKVLITYGQNCCASAKVPRYHLMK